MADFGYDIADYREVDPLFGRMADFDRLLDRAQALGLKVMIDQVLSHTSVAHEWFRESRENRTDPRADWYVWADAKADPWLWFAASAAAVALVYLTHVDRQLYLLAGGLAAYGAVQIAAGFSRSRNLFTDIIADMHAMPETMRQLALVQFFSWFALFATWIYTTAAVTAVHFGSTDTQSVAYNDGANWVGVLFAAYNAFAALAAMVIPFMTRRFGLRISHLANLCLGGLGLISFLLIGDPHWLLLSMAGVGFAWASILSLPYALLSDSVPADKMGVYMGIFNFFIVIPQLLAASVLGIMLKTFFGNAPINALLIGGVSLIVAGLFTLRVREN